MRDTRDDGGANDHQSSPAASVPFTLPPGQPASGETVMAITAAERSLIACLNAGDWLRYFALT